MISPKYVVLPKIFSALSMNFPGIKTSSAATDVPARFPFVSVVESNNVPVDSRRTANSLETAVRVSYEVNIYSNALAGEAVLEAEKILDVVDDTFKEIGFGRKASNPMQNLMDVNIYRHYALYKATIVPEYDEITDTTTYRVYAD